VKQRNPGLGKRALKTLEALCRVLEILFLRLLDQRIDDIDLLTSLEGRAHLTQNRRTRSRWHHPCLHGCAARRALPQYRVIQISENRERERARNRCRCHHQDVRMLTLLAQLSALLDAEAMLLVDDHQA
jgi:hypothetical protein